MTPSYCLSCMAAAYDSSELCPYCGRRKAVYNDPHQLRAGTILNERYLVGRILGQGGFGITYIGRDITLDDMVAIKEYYPSEISTRNNTISPTVYVANTTQSETYIHGKSRFLDEARTLRKFKKEPGIVGVQDFFEDNGTAYIIMEYLDGMTLREYVRRRGTLSADETVNLMFPVISALCRVHDEGLIHRDISPENIMVLGNGNLKILDFGAAREFAADKSVSVMLKPGYAPIEQYRSRGSLGPWTDTYALCATMYFCMTGTPPDDSIDRMMEDDLKYPSELGAAITPQQEEDIIRRGMSLNPEERWQSMDELGAALSAELSQRSMGGGSTPVTGRRRRVTRTKKKKPRRTGIILGAAAALVLLALILTGAIIDIGGFAKALPTAAPVESAAPGAEPVSLSLPTEGLHHITFLSGGESEEQIASAKRILEERIAILCDGTDYYTETSGDSIELYMDYAVLGTEAPDLVIYHMLAAPMQMYIGTLDLAKEQRLDECVELSPGSVEDVLFSEEAPAGADPEDYADETGDISFVNFIFSDKFVKKNEDTIKGYGDDAIAFFLHPNGTIYYFYFYSTDEKDSYYSVAEGWTDNLAQLFCFDLTGEDMPCAFSYSIDIYALWETQDSANNWGEFQCNVEELEGETVAFSLQGYSMASDGELIDSAKTIKDRLDLIGMPYAFSIYNDEQEEKCYAVIRTSVERMGEPVMNILGQRYALDVHMGMNSVNAEKATLEKADGKWRLRVELQSYYLEEYAALAQRIAKDGSYRVNITDNNNYPLMLGTMNEAFTDELYFDRLLLDGENPIDEDKLWAAQLVENVINIDTIPINFYLSQYRLYNELGKEDSSVVLGINTKKFLAEASSTVTSVYKGASVSESDNMLRIRLHLPVTDELASTATELVREIYTALDFESLPYSSIGFYLVDENNDVNERARMFFSKNYSYGTEEEGGVYTYGIFANGRLDPYREEFLEIVNYDEFYAQFCDERFTSWG